MQKRLQVGVFVLGVALLGAVASASAAPMLIIKDFGGGPPPPNDCTGVFGGGKNGPCDVGFALQAEVSPWIAKFNVDGAEWSINDAFGSVDGSEFTIIGGSTGTWSYNPVGDDPAVRFWVAKGGNTGFRLHWMVDSATVGTACQGDTYNLACLNQALSVTSGTWSTLGQGLSHMTFYDTGNTTQVSEPVTLALFGVGALGLGFFRRRNN